MSTMCDNIILYSVWVCYSAISFNKKVNYIIKETLQIIQRTYFYFLRGQ